MFLSCSGVKQFSIVSYISSLGSFNTGKKWYKLVFHSLGQMHRPAPGHDIYADTLAETFGK